MRCCLAAAVVRVCLCWALVWIASAHTHAGNWLQFRGPQGNGNAAVGDLPVSWSVETNENVAWKAALPGRGPSSPIVVQDRAVVTCSSGPQQNRLHILAVDCASGDRLWERQFWATGRTYCHPTSANAAPTPASDGRRIVALFSSCDLICLDVDGNLLWYRALAIDYPKAGNDVGMSSSPVIAGDTVIVQIECQGDSFVEGIDLQSGDTRWHLPRERRSNWCSPTVVADSAFDEPQLLLQSPEEIAVHDVKSGKPIWQYPASCDLISSGCAAEGVVLVPADGLTALRPNRESDEVEVMWRENRLQPGAASPVVYKDRVYVVNRVGVVAAAEIASGEIVWRKRIGGAYWATPVIADDRLYATNDKGQVVVLSLEKNGEVLRTNQFGEKMQATPAVAGDALYFRSDAHLWKIGK